MTSKEVDRDSDSDGQGASEVKTVPPPAGASDAYNAPTRVAELDASAYAALLEQYAAPQIDETAAPPEAPPPEAPASEPAFPVELAPPAMADATVELPPAAPLPAAPPPSVGDEAEAWGDVAPAEGSRWTLVGWIAFATVVVAFAAVGAMWLTR